MVLRCFQSNTKWRLGLVIASTNPEGIEAFSPALRATRYAGSQTPRFQYPEGVASEAISDCCSTPSGLRNLNAITQGSPSRNRGNPGLKDSILSGLRDWPLKVIDEQRFLFHQNSEEPKVSPASPRRSVKTGEVMHICAGRGSPQAGREVCGRAITLTAHWIA